jgi:calreticulin
MKFLLAIVTLTAALMLAQADEKTVYFTEKFEDGEDFRQRWVESSFKGSEQGLFKIANGKFYGDAEKDIGIQTSQDARFYGISAKVEPFSNEGKSLVVQFTVKHEQKIDCGGGYIKLYPADLDQSQLNGDSKYLVMFGPDICGYSTKKVHVIFNYNGQNLLIKKEIKCKDDEFTHLYTLVLNPDNTYVVKIDNEKVESGRLEDDWAFLAPKTIPDPSASKPADWVDLEKIDDPSDTKPADWDKPEFVEDPEAKKPEDWDDEVDGEWQPAKINNPEFKGEWKAKQIDNPLYKGAWVHPEIENPDYKPDSLLYRHENIGAVGFDLWQVKSGTIFDNILVTDNEAYAEEFGKETWGVTKEPEAKMKADQDEVERKAEEAKRKEEDEKRKAEEASKPAEPESTPEEIPAGEEKDEL